MGKQHEFQMVIKYFKLGASEIIILFYTRKKSQRSLCFTRSNCLPLDILMSTNNGIVQFKIKTQNLSFGGEKDLNET